MAQLQSFTEKSVILIELNKLHKNNQKFKATINILKIFIIIKTEKKIVLIIVYLINRNVSN